MKTFSSAVDSELYGGKGQGLRMLHQDGIPVPDFFCLNSIALSPYAEKIRNKDSLGEIAAELSRTKVYQDLVSWVAEHPSKMGYAIRSSMVGEDGQQQSMAGAFDTKLNVDSEDILAATLEVMASCFRQSGFLKPAVVIQVMLEPDFAGVMLTASPQDPMIPKVLISAGRGLGDGVVNGTADCDEYTYNLRTGIWSERLLQSTPLLSSRQKQSLLDYAQLLSKNKFSEKPYPLDIEWAIQNEKVWILQCRRLNSVSRRAHFVLDNSNIQESYCGVTSPLTFSFAVDAYEKVYAQVMILMGFSDQQIESQSIRHRKLLSYFQGRVYYNIQSWYEGLMLLPGFTKNKKDLQRMMGVQHDVGWIHDQHYTFIQKLKKLPVVLSIAFRLGFAFSRIESYHRRFQSRFLKLYQEYSEIELNQLGLEDLLKVARRAKQDFLASWGEPILNDFFVMMKNGSVMRSLESVGAENLYSDLVKDAEGFNPVKELRNLQENFSRSVGWKFASDSGFRELAGLKAVDEQLYQQICNFIQQFGDRVAGELKLESQSFEMCPRRLLDLIEQGMYGSEASETSSGAQQNSEVGDFKSLSKLGYFQRLKLNRNLNALKKGIFYRESMRLCRTKVFGIFRKIYLEIGLVLTQERVLRNQQEIFFLTESEIADLIEGKSVLVDLAAEIEIRKKTLEKWSSQEPPGHFSVPLPRIPSDVLGLPQMDPLSAGIASDSQDPNQLMGIGCYPGAITAEVVVVANASDLSALKPGALVGKILVAMRTDPGWVPYFRGLAGLLVERGSALSHSAIVAREMKIPTIVNIPRLTEILQTSDLVQMDGSRGQILRLDERILSGGLHGPDFTQSL